MKKKNERRFQPIKDWVDGIPLGRKVAGRLYHFIEITDMDEACGKDNEGRPKYVVELTAVNLDEIPESGIKSAMDCCGLNDSHFTEKITEYMKAEACHMAGAKAVLHSGEHGSYHKGAALCRKMSYELEEDPRKFEDMMNRTVNKIGSSAREAMQGDFISAMTRGVLLNDPEANLMAKIYGAKPEELDELRSKHLGLRGGLQIQIILGHPELRDLCGGHSKFVEENNHQVLSENPGDPLAYSMGFLNGLHGRGEAPSDDLASMYVKGYKHGVEVRLGNQPMPVWAV